MHCTTVQTYMPWLLGVSPLYNGWQKFGQEMSVIIGNLLDGINTTDEPRQFCLVNVLGECPNLFRMYLTRNETCISNER